MTFNNKDIIYYGTLIAVDPVISNIKIIVMISSIVILLQSLDYYKQQNLVDYEFPILVLLTTLGILLLISARDIITLYLAIEIMSLSSYILATIKRNSQYSTEAGIKYFLLGAVSSGIILFGCALIYALAGTTSYEGLTAYI